MAGTRSLAGIRGRQYWVVSGALGKLPCGLGKSLSLSGLQFPQPQRERLNLGLWRPFQFWHPITKVM